MADETLTGSKTEVEVDTNAAAESSDRKKKLVKYLLIAVAAVAAFWLIKKFILRK